MQEELTAALIKITAEKKKRQKFEGDLGECLHHLRTVLADPNNLDNLKKAQAWLDAGEKEENIDDIGLKDLDL
jgi:hypothetical protein